MEFPTIRFAKGARLWRCSARVELAAIVRPSRGTDLTAASVGASSQGRSAGCTAECRQLAPPETPPFKSLMANPITHSDHTRSSPGPGVELRWPAAALWRAGEPEVRKITTTDVWEALAQGYDDFRAIPTHALFICLIYPVAGRSLPAFVRLRDLAAALSDDSGLRIARAVRRYRSLRIEPPPGTRSRHNANARF